MLFRQSLIYLWARGLPSLVSFAALAFYTRLLAPDEFGTYAMVMAGVYLINAVAFQWLRISLLRFAGSDEDRPGLLSTALAGYGIIIGFTLTLTLVATFITSSSMRPLLLFGLLLVWLTAAVELNLTLMRVRLEATRYGLVSVTKAVVTVLVSMALALAGWGVWSLLIGFAVGTASSSLLFLRSLWSEARWSRVDRTKMVHMLRYGLPLTASLSASYVVRGSDRLLLGWLAHPSAAGMYAAAYDLASNSLEVLMGVINTAAFSLAVNAFERGGVEAARVQLSQNIVALSAVALPAAAGLAALAPGISKLYFGASYSVEAATLIPWVALAVLLSGVRAYYVDHAFQLGQNTMKQAYVLVLAAGVNLGLNVLLIPGHGALGAIYATVLAYTSALVAGILLSRGAFPLPFPRMELLKLSIASAGMGLCLWFLPPAVGTWTLLSQVGLGVVLYASILFLLGSFQLRNKLRARLRQGRHP